MLNVLAPILACNWDRYWPLSGLHTQPRLKYQTRVEETDSNERSSLLRYGMHKGRKIINSTDPMSRLRHTNVLMATINDIQLTWPEDIFFWSEEIRK